MIEQNLYYVNKLFMNEENSESSRTYVASDGGADLFAGMKEITCIYYFCLQGNTVFHAVGVNTVNRVVFVHFVFLHRT